MKCTVGLAWKGSVCGVFAAALVPVSGCGSRSGVLVGAPVNPGSSAGGVLVGASGGALSAAATAEFMAQRKKELDAALAPEIQAGQATVELLAGNSIEVSMTGPRMFPPQSTVIDPAFVPTLRTVAGVVTQQGKMAVTVIGYPDASGDAAPDLLAYQRAEAVRVQLIGMGVKPILVSATDSPGSPRTDGRVQIVLAPIQSR